MTSNVVRIGHYDVDWRPNSCQCSIDTAGLGSRRLDPIFDNQQVQVTVFVGITTRLRTKHDDLLRVTDRNNPLDDFG